MKVAVPLYDGFTALDAVGPYEVLVRLPGAQVCFAAAVPGPQRADTGALVLLAEHRLEDVADADVLVVPGGPGSRRAVNDTGLVSWVADMHRTTRWTTSVCTGSLLLGAAGVLDGLEATTHWLALDLLASYGAHPTRRRVVEQGKVITAAGVSAGIDMALRLVELEAGAEAAQAIQLSIEYDPQPPFDAGSPDKAPPAVVELVRGRKG